MPALVAVGGLLISLLLFGWMRASERGQAHRTFDLAATRQLAEVQVTLGSDVDEIGATAALFDSSDQVDADEFESFTDNQFRRHPAIRTIASFKAVPPNVPLSFHVGLVEGPEDGGLQQGAELVASKGLGADLVACFEEKKVVLSTSFGPANPGAGKRILAAHNFHDKAGNLTGVVASWIDLELALASASGAGEEDSSTLTVLDVTGSEPVRLAGAATGTGLERRMEFDLGGRKLQLVSIAPPGFVASRRSLWPWAALLLGLLASGALVLTVVTANAHLRDRELVDRRTREIIASYEDLSVQAEQRVQAVAERQQIEHRLRALIDLVPDMIYVKDWDGNILLANQATAEAFGTTVEELVDSLESDHRSVAGGVLESERALMVPGASAVLPAVPFVDASGRRRILRTKKLACDVFEGDRPTLLCISADITEERHAALILRSQSRMMTHLAEGADPDRLLSELVEAAQEIVPQMRCSVLLLSDDGQHLEHACAPRLPDFYNEAIHGLEIGPTVGSCGAAAFLREPVIVEDVRTHPNWAGYQEIAKRADIRACWSQPIRGSDGEVLGTFAMYYADPRAPEPFEEELIESMAELARAAIEHGRERARS